MTTPERRTPPLPSRLGPGYATIDDLRRRWRVSRSTAVRLAEELGLEPSPLGGRPRWTWRSIWAAEGRRNPPPEMWERLQAPLLTPDEIGASQQARPRTVRDWIATGRLPVIALGPRTRRIDPDALDDLSAASDRAPVRRSGADAASTAAEGDDERRREAKGGALSDPPSSHPAASQACADAYLRRKRLAAAPSEPAAPPPAETPAGVPRRGRRPGAPAADTRP